jgi:hypothetical protein
MLPAQGFQDSPRALAGYPAAPATAAGAPHLEGAPGQIAQRLVEAETPRSVVFDQPGDGRLWALGATYKASFAADGFVYVPFFGSQAPKNYPVRFVLRAVRVGQRDLAFAADAAVTRSDSRVTLDRGLVREVYDLTPSSVEQTFVVDGTLPGDVDVELEVVTGLVEDPARPGLQFGNHLGHVDYGTAYLVHDSAKSEIPASFAGRTLRLHVPAAQRGPGPVVIDPLITTFALTPTLMKSEIPDVAYDATTDRWLITWVHIFSDTDHDVVVELRTGTGDAVAGSYRTIDATAHSYSWPRVANLNSADRFLIAFERYVPTNPVGQQYTVWGRTMNAASPFTMSGQFEISPASTSNQNSVDVGGDPGTGTRWTVVWTHGTDIHARQVEANGTLSPTTIPVENTSAPCINPQISLSNGNGLTPAPRWCIVYMLHAGTDNWDVYGAVINASGTITKAHSPIANGTQNDMYCYLSSPMTDVGSGPAFLVSYERQGSPPEMMVRLVDANLGALVPEVNLTRRFGFSGIYCRVESDGCRFAALCQTGTTIRVGTLALAGNDLLLHEAPVTVSTGVSPNLASKRSGGGDTTDYGIVFANTTYTPWRAMLGLYQGKAPVGGFNRRGTSCGLSINYSGQTSLGQTMTFTLPSTGTDLAALLFGVPAPALALCANCWFGLDLSQPMVLFPAPLNLPVPRAPLLVGAKVAVQGFAFGSGPCMPSRLRLSDTIDATIQ